jgi:hypothetical protein
MGAHLVDTLLLHAWNFTLQERRVAWSTDPFPWNFFPNLPPDPHGASSGCQPLIARSGVFSADLEERFDLDGRIPQ